MITCLAVGLFALVLTGPAGPASAQSGSQGYQSQLLRLAEVMGSLHYLRSLCDRNDSQIWRSNMMKLLDLERPPQDVRAQMVSRFNGSYEENRRNYSRCSSGARSRIRSLAGEGERLINGLSR